MAAIAADTHVVDHMEEHMRIRDGRVSSTGSERNRELAAATGARHRAEDALDQARIASGSQSEDETTQRVANPDTPMNAELAASSDGIHNTGQSSGKAYCNGANGKVASSSGGAE